MKPIFTYKGNIYSYTVINGVVTTYRIDQKNPEDIFKFDEETQKQLEVEFAEYETTLNEKELRIWREE